MFQFKMPRLLLLLLLLCIVTLNAAAQGTAEAHHQRAVGSVDGLKEKFVVQQFLFPAQTGDRNTLRIGVVVVGNK